LGGGALSLLESYLRTTYRVTELAPPVDIRIGEPCPALDALLDLHTARSWAFITAWNPGSKKLGAAENQRRQAALEAEVKQGGTVFYRGAGIPDDATSAFRLPSSSSAPWEPEESLLIIGMDREQAVKLGKKYAQAAIVAGDRSAPAQLVFIN